MIDYYRSKDSLSLHLFHAHDEDRDRRDNARVRKQSETL